MKRKHVVVVGATGSIGRQTLEIVHHFPDELIVVGLAGGHRAEPMVDVVASSDVLRRSVRRIVMADDEAAAQVKDGLAVRGLLGGDGEGPAVYGGRDALIDMVSAEDVDLVVMAMVGAEALVPTLAALEAGKDVALATKEVLVAGGQLVTAAAQRSGARLLPVDSEHSAIFQCLQGESRQAVERLLLTASGGPFRSVPKEELARVTPEEALRHPTWRMGPKVTIDSATLMNKGLEVIEARWLFDVPIDRIDVVVHPQSIVHSCVELVDGSILAHLGPTDMRIPIQYALLYPRRMPSPVRRLSLADVGQLTFELPDRERFPALELAYEAARQGGTMPAVLNAANEVAVQLFLQRRIGFLDIPRLVERAMADHQPQAATLENVLAADRWARNVVSGFRPAAVV
ncbi:MAG: 1-deoxy-D-xylulose-5-phosphate reductoisomerase [Limnochordales bacterium]